MRISKIPIEDMGAIAPLFEPVRDTLILTCLQGFMGEAWGDCKSKHASAQIVVADFCFFAGEPCEALVKNLCNAQILDPMNAQWARLIEKVYGARATKKTRYAIKKERDIFDLPHLERLASTLERGFELRLIDEALYSAVLAEKWSEDLCANFKTYAEFCSNGLGVVALHGGEIVSGASSYTAYRGGIEIEVDTKLDYRRRGLALACCARLICECARLNLYPSWDAQNKASVALAEKLGYHFDCEYEVYEIAATEK